LIYLVPQVLDNIIVKAVPDPATYSVKVTWANGETTVNRFDHLVDKGVFAALTYPSIFARVRIGERGRGLEWPGEIDFCADALWFETHPADAPNGHSGRSVIRRRIMSPDVV
jgi:Protein of unknown function (DUF2442)